MISRRAILSGAAVLPLAGCTSVQIANFQQQWANFIDSVNSILSKGCGALPGFVATANTIEAVVAAFYPTGAAAIAAGAAAIAAVAGAICNTVPAAPKTALSANLLSNTSAGIVTFVGNTNVNGRIIPVQGYSVR